MLRLKPVLKNYAWGIPTNQNCLAKLFNSESHYDVVAEAWWGSHPSGKATFDNGETIEDVPYLLKVISVNKALSIQVHPDKENAEILHNQNPTLYPDPYPKPEMALALTKFEALCGFLHEKVIRANLIAFPEFAELAGGKDVEPFKAIQNLLTASDEVVKRNIKVLKRRIFFKRIHTETEHLILELMEQYPDDRGVFAPLFMNYVCLEPGWVLIIPPGEIHAYLRGQAVECMAPSDNVIRAGLTSKHCDINTLLSLVKKEYTKPIIVPPQKEYYHEVFKEYFKMYILGNDSEFYNVKKYPTIILIVEGNGSINGKKVKKGDSFLLLDDYIIVKGDDIVSVAVVPTSRGRY